ncbi:MAG: DNA gyrase/topoisomerase IV subunit A [Brevinema sp.]
MAKGKITFPSDNPDNITPSYFETELETSYLNYAYSVITGRAIPDARDGMKPVHRRILYSMQELGITHEKQTRKSARVVGDVLGKFHPHGDASVYNAAVRLGQDFASRYPLVIGQGNFGSLDNDPPAAMRYTEMKLSKTAYYIINDIDKDTVDFRPNFDDTMQEPIVLPGMFPALLCNGTEGIAVGFSTGIPPHNLQEVVLAASAYIDNPDIETSGLMQYVKGPDFPTGGRITNPSNIATVYETGKGSVRLAGVMEWEEKTNSLVITEIPYQTIKSRIVAEIVELMADDHSKYATSLRHIKEVRDESSSAGLRVVIELIRTGGPAEAEKIKAIIYKETQMEKNISINMITLRDNRPELFGLKALIETYIGHRRNVTDRRHRFEKRKIEERLHIVLGLLIAQANIDDVVRTIRESSDPKNAKERLVANFVLSEIQAQAILDMRLQRITALEVHKLEAEKAELEKRLRELIELLENPKKRDDLIKQELTAMVEDIGDERRTALGALNIEEITNEEFIENKPMHLAVSHQGYLFVEIDPGSKTSSRGGKRTGSATGGRKLGEDDLIIASASCNIKDTILFFSSDGKAYSLKGYEIAGSSSGAQVRHINTVPRLESMSGSIAAVMFINKFDENSNVMFATAQGQGVRIPLKLFSNISRVGVIALKLRAGDRLVSAVRTDGESLLVFLKRRGKGFKLSEKLFTPHSRGAMGERAIKVEDTEDSVVGMRVDEPGKYILAVSQNGKGRRVAGTEAKQLENRGGKGYWIINTKEGELVADFAFVDEADRFVVISQGGQRAVLKASDISNRASQLLVMKIDDQLTTLSVMPEEDQELKASKEITDQERESLY